MNANLLKILKEKLLQKEKQTAQAFQQKKNQYQAAVVQPKGQQEPELQKQQAQSVPPLPVEKKIYQAPPVAQQIKQSQQANKNSNLFDKLLALKAKKNQSNLSNSQKQTKKNQKPAEDIISEPVSQAVEVKPANNNDASKKQSSLKQLLAKLQKSKSLQNQSNLPALQTPNTDQPKLIENSQAQKVASAEQINEKPQRVLKDYQNFNQESLITKNKPLILSNNEQKIASQKQQNISLDNKQQNEPDQKQQPLQSIPQKVNQDQVINQVQNGQETEKYISNPIPQNQQQSQLEAQNKKQAQQLIQQKQVVFQADAQYLVSARDEEQAINQPKALNQEQALNQQQAVDQVLASHQEQILHQQQQPIHHQEKALHQQQVFSLPKEPQQPIQERLIEKSEPQNKVMQKLNAMMEKMRKMKEINQNREKPAPNLSPDEPQNQVKPIQNSQPQQNVIISKAEDIQEDQHEQNLENEEEIQEEGEKDIQQKTSKLSKQQSKKAKIFLKELEKIGKITHNIKTIMAQKYNYEQKTTSCKVIGIVDLIRKLELVIERND